MKKLLLTTTALVTFAAVGAAGAADLPLKAPPMAPIVAPVFSWTGFYIGGQVGGAWGHDDDGLVNPGVPVAINIPFTINTRSVIGGAHAGYNLQFNQFVVGVEGSVDWTSLRDTSVVGICPLFCGTFTTKSDAQGSLRARAGIAFDRALLYATGGLAVANITNTYDTTAFGGGFASISTTRTGGTVGGGIQYAVTNNVSLRGEYRYTDFGSYTDKSAVAFFPATNVNRHFTESQAEVGLSYKFDWASPVVARY
jgi:outer membrane immunogenic protein